MNLIVNWSLRGLACTLGGASIFALAQGCGGSDTSGAGLGGAGNTDGGAATGGTGATGGSGTGGTGGSGTGGTGATGGSGGCPSNLASCDGTCVDTQNNPTNCGTCGNACQPGEYCSAGTCTSTCAGGQICSNQCVNVQIDPQNCGSCGNACGAGDNCVGGTCTSGCAGATLCGTVCVNIQIDPQNCGGCGTVCGGTQLCQAGQCVDTCSGGLVKCGSSCVNTSNDKNNCGACGTVCPTGQDCIGGSCAVCDSNATDCDGDGWNGTQGDCCDKPGVCGANPELVNPGAYEVVGNGVDDNCNGLADLFDKLDTQPCDTGLASDSGAGTDYAKAIDICRTTTETPATPKDKTWGLISAELFKADGTALTALNARSIRPKFGNGISPLKGANMALISSGIAADATQTTPGPNGGAPAGFNVSSGHTSNVNIQSCASADCVKDWFGASNPPLKAANQYPAAPACGGAGGGGTANDSVMIKLKLRAPTNARAFSFNSYFFSAEYPEFVCTSFNDQFIALVKTPSGTPSPIPNPVDLNLMTYTDLTKTPPAKFPIGINVAAGTNLFAVCDPAVLTPSSGCYDSSVAAASCSLGAGDLTGTGYEKPTTGSCVIGGATYWLTTAGNVIPGQIVEIRMVIFDVGDTAYDSAALIDGFEWLPNATLPGTG